MSQEENATNVAPVAPRISINQCKAFLKEGKTRKEIAEYYGVPVSVMAEKVWSHPELKGLKTKKIFALELIDDTKEVSQEAVQAEEEVAAMVPVEGVSETVSEVESEVTTESNEAFAGNLQAEIGEATPATNLWQ